MDPNFAKILDKTTENHPKAKSGLFAIGWGDSHGERTATGRGTAMRRGQPWVEDSHGEGQPWREDSHGERNTQASPAYREATVAYREVWVVPGGHGKPMGILCEPLRGWGLFDR